MKFNLLLLPLTPFLIPSAFGRGLFHHQRDQHLKPLGKKLRNLKLSWRQHKEIKKEIHVVEQEMRQIFPRTLDDNSSNFLSDTTTQPQQAQQAQQASRLYDKNWFISQNGVAEDFPEHIRDISILETLETEYQIK